jgi:hypothetical protein
MKEHFSKLIEHTNVEKTFESLSKNGGANNLSKIDDL